VRDLFTSAGVTNVQWVWCPNVPYAGSTDLPGLYPGDAYADLVGLDGYNWGTTQSWGSTWVMPDALFGQGLSELAGLAPSKQVLIAETASAEQGGDKAAWNQSLIQYLSANPGIMGFAWFDLSKEVDWRIDSSSSSASAFAAALAARP
jgi:beta-mannanase